MPERSADWFRQAEADLRHARHAAESEDFEWAAFAAQQAGANAVKALCKKVHVEAPGQAMSLLLASLPDAVGAAPCLDAARRLDKHYIPARYPNGFERGAPVDFYTPGEATQAIADAEEILGFCGRQIGR